MNFQYHGRHFEINGAPDKSYVYRMICKKSTFYEIDLLEYVAGFMKDSGRKNSIAIDVGANIGNHSVFFQSFLTEYLIAVEPNPDTLPVLKSNLSKNIENYTIYEVGLGETPGRGKIFFPDGEKGDMGKARLNIGNGDINVTTLDAMVEDWQAPKNMAGRITLIKIDVEGMELSVLKGAKKTIEKHRPHLLLEAKTSSDLSNLKNYLREFGYLPLCYYAGAPVYHFSYKPTPYVRFKAKFIKFVFKIKSKIKWEIRKLISAKDCFCAI
jgi:FkbM family methyltransferase